MPSLFDRVRRVAADIFETPVDQLGAQSSPDNVENWDSMRHLSLVLALEQEFAVEFSPEEIEQLLSLDLITDLIIEKAQAKGAIECRSNSDMPERTTTAESASF